MMTKSISDLAHEVGLVLFVDSEGHCVGVTDERLIPKAVYHNDERLNKLLAPFAAAVIAQYRESLLAGVGHMEWLGYDPERGDMPGYTADQMAAAVLREMERIAELVEGEDVQHPKYIAAAIRGQR